MQNYSLIENGTKTKKFYFYSCIGLIECSNPDISFFGDWSQTNECTKVSFQSIIILKINISFLNNRFDQNQEMNNVFYLSKEEQAVPHR